jgi:hypothetical protein
MWITIQEIASYIFNHLHNDRCSLLARSDYHEKKLENNVEELVGDVRRQAQAHRRSRRGGRRAWWRRSSSVAPLPQQAVPSVKPPLRPPCIAVGRVHPAPVSPGGLPPPSFLRRCGCRSRPRRRASGRRRRAARSSRPCIPESGSACIGSTSCKFCTVQISFTFELKLRIFS